MKHKLISVTVLLAGLMCSTPASRAQDFKRQVGEAAKAMERAEGEPLRLLNEGHFKEANEKLMAVFPKDHRIPAEAFVLGANFVHVDPRLSYQFHKEAAAGAATEPMVQLEWAMEQHRATEYEGALAWYNRYSKESPEFAPVHGLAADCLVRLGRTQEAVARWRKSEAAKSGTLAVFESLVNKIYGDSSNRRQRAELRLKAGAGDLDALVGLVALDADFERDWWNKTAIPNFLEQDVRLLRGQTGSKARIEAALCVVDCYLPEDPSKEEIEAILKRHGYLMDPRHTLPSDSALASLLFGIAFKTGALTVERARPEFGEKLLADGLKTKDRFLLNVAAHLFVSTDSALEVERKAWEATGDARFAGGYLGVRMEQGKLLPDDPLLLKAMKEFPEDSWILRIAIQATTRPGPDLLIRGIKSEYRHFSALPGGRPSARMLRSYFDKLARAVPPGPE